MKNKHFAFTLAEIMIVLSVVGILTAILLPVAFQSAPDENIMKFKKANATLGTVIRELVNSDKYYANGDLGIKADGTLVNWDNTDNFTYFCETLAEVMTTKKVSCSSTEAPSGGSIQTYADGSFRLNEAKAELDKYCKQNAAIIGAEIETPEGIVYYQGGPNRTFGSTVGHAGLVASTTRNFGQDGYYKDENGFDCCYKIFCIDVDGIPNSATSDDCVNECPFGYGIRADGKILPGIRADEWVNKSVQKTE